MIVCMCMRSCSCTKFSLKHNGFASLVKKFSETSKTFLLLSKKTPTHSMRCSILEWLHRLSKIPREICMFNQHRKYGSECAIGNCPHKYIAECTINHLPQQLEFFSIVLTYFVSFSNIFSGFKINEKINSHSNLQNVCRKLPHLHIRLRNLIIFFICFHCTPIKDN